MLASLVLPALSNARETSRRRTCLNGLKQIGVAGTMFQDDNDGYVLHNYQSNVHSALDWLFGLNPYLGGKSEIGVTAESQFKNEATSVFYNCPTSNDDAGWVFAIDYGAPNRGNNPWTFVGYKIEDINSTSDSLFLADIYKASDKTKGRSAFNLKDNYLELTGTDTGEFKHNHLV
ncbi:hypothetical protein LNTAR_08399 [Lentisphaera araneosa HTCC2155]|uniref:Uncharacterized protein n=1 Tax=Lentisphaera araneosa HTCC2155 TaxID=313628 RepID=A6DHS1_9BACT|nr:DUF1559 domain-containing protein [Lentisphaera araneosa]EDM28575.1 hypothetical protein LNTAR_08399 [Lentisphaera araneosa HTCC2155]